MSAPWSFAIAMPPISPKDVRTRVSNTWFHDKAMPDSSTVAAADFITSSRGFSVCMRVSRFSVMVEVGSARRSSSAMSTRPMFSGHTGSHAPHSVHAETDGAISAMVAPCCRALARPCGV